jgi:tetratricopeptide (TPR) repeat protein
MNPIQRRGADCFSLFALPIAFLILHASGRNHPFILFDDYGYVSNNPHVASGWTMDAFRWSLTGTVAGHWHPLTWWTHLTDVSLFGLDAGAHVVVNLVLHAVFVGLLFVLMRRFGITTGGAVFTGAVYILHPVFIESYAWVAERKDVLAGALFLATLHSWTSWVRRPRGSMYVATLALFAASLMAKPMTVTLPAVLLLLDFWPFARHRIELRRRILERLPFFALSAASSIITVISQRNDGSMVSLSAAGLGDRLANAITACLWYLQTWLVPNGLSILHPWRAHSWLEVLIAIAVIGGVTAAAWGLRRRTLAVLTGWLWFLGMLVPILGLVQVGSQAVAERYYYLPAIGMCIAIVTAKESFRIPDRGAAAIAACWLLLLSPIHFDQFRRWESSTALFEQVTARYPENSFGHHLLGLALLEERKWARAETELRRALEIETGNQPLRRGRVYGTWLGKTFESLAALVGDRGNHGEAVMLFRRALAVDPESYFARLHLGIHLAVLGDTRGSIVELRRAVQRAPQSIEARVQLALSLAAAGKRAEAADQLTQARRIDRVRANRYLEHTAHFTPRPDNLERYMAYLRATPPLHGAPAERERRRASIGVPR